LNKGEGLRLYRTLTLIRRAEEAIRLHYGEDDMKTPVHLSIGQEAIPVGVCHVLPEGSPMFGTYRNHALYLALTDDTDRFFAELHGKEAGMGRGKAGSMHLCEPSRGLLATSAVVGTTIPLAVGAALAQAYRHLRQPVAVFFGDGAAEEGVFWESLNFACQRSLNLLFVCEDNGLAIHAPAADRRGFSSITQAVGGFRCCTATADGSDLSAIIEATRALYRDMEADKQPGLLHVSYFRFLEHVGIGEDFFTGYRQAPSDQERRERDPLIRFSSHLLSLGYHPAELRAIDVEVDDQICRSIGRARSADYPTAEALCEDLWV
jgi:TPP-dependent pyruvate/acetoin dehydrogenase alpha subunit